MRVIKFIVFACFFIIFIVIANLIHKNLTSYEVTGISSSFNYYNILSYSNNDIKSLVSLSFKTSFDSLASIFDMDKSLLKNTIIKKSINIREEEADLIIFTGSDSIEQITINTSNNADAFLDNLLNDLNSNNIQLEKEILDDENGNILAEIYFYKTVNYKFVITKSNNDLAIDYINLKV
ncbi:hypothetical protein [Brachyspira alvinipulli]|uniref:hypothetical protein n=1 Tax=Brachyspira alvinipulli TaxID=84379 RepID=UPI000484BF3A|nr:hypothetical protein [Brachyspira alvinipulli]